MNVKLQNNAMYNVCNEKRKQVYRAAMIAVEMTSVFEAVLTMGFVHSLVDFIPDQIVVSC